MPARKSRQKAPRPGKRSRPVREARRAGAVIVGLGASAGGLAALEQFFRNVPPDLGAAFVVVQHLDPEHASVLVELLQRVTSLPVVEVTDGMEVRADTVYVIPPNREMERLRRRRCSSRSRALRAASGWPWTASSDRWPESEAPTPSAWCSPGPAPTGRSASAPSGTPAASASRRTPATARFDGMPAAAIAAVAETQVAPASSCPPSWPAPWGRWPPGHAARPPLEPSPLGSAESWPSCARPRGTTSRSTSGPRSSGASSGGWPQRRRGRRGLRPLPDGAPGRGADALPGTAHQRHELLPRSGGLRGAAVRRS